MPTRDTPIPWGQYSTDQTETLLAALILRLHRNASRMDGAGGDGGVDVLDPVSGGHHIFEIKSFYERLTEKQKKQIEKSLKTAVANRTDMVAWSLVLPLDHSPAEEKWMTEELTKLTSVPVNWIGRGRIEELLAQYRDLVRTFAPGSVEHRALDYLAAHYLEQAAPPNDMPEGLRRAARLRQQLGELDPYYDFDVELGADRITTTIRPKDEHAPPIEVHLRMQAKVGSAEAENIESFMTYGRPLTLGPENIADWKVSLPAGIGENFTEFTPIQASVGPAPAAAPMRRPARLDAVDSAGRVLRTLAVEWTQQSEGVLGGSFLSGIDRSGFLEITLTKGTGLEGDFTFHTRNTGDMLPGDVLPALRFIHDLGRAHALHIVGDGMTIRLTVPDAAQNASRSDLIRILEALDRIQAATGCIFPVPETLTAHDVRDILFADELLKYGRALYVFPDVVVTLPLEEVRQLLDQGPFPRAYLKGKPHNSPIELFGNKITLPSNYFFDASKLLVREPLTLARICDGDHAPARLQVGLTTDNLSISTFYLGEPIISE